MDILLELARENAAHITVLNREMGSVLARIDNIEKLLWFMVFAIVGLAINEAFKHWKNGRG